MEDSDRIEVTSNVLLGAANLLMVLLTYLSITFLTLIYLKHWHNVDLLGMFEISLRSSYMPLLVGIFEFLQVLLKHALISIFLISIVYAAHIANYKVVIENGKMKYRSGFFLLKNSEFEIEDVEQVYTEDYTFMGKTKELCIKALDEELIRIPYVRNAKEVKKAIINRVKSRHHELEVEEKLQAPINVMSWNTG